MTTNQQIVMFVQSARMNGIQLDELLFNIRREFVMDSLRDNRVNICKTARELGIHRNTLTRQLDELKINMPELRLEVRAPKRGVHSVRIASQESAQTA